MSPAVPAPSGDYFPAMLKRFQTQINALATQQNFSFTDSEGNIRLQVGRLANGDFGMLVVDPVTGAENELLPIVANSAPALQTTASVPFVTFADGPTISANIGASGTALIRIGAMISPGASVTGSVVVNMDGTFLATAPQLQASGGSVSLTVSSAMAELEVPGIPPGEHSFELAYSGSGTSCGFQFRTITVQPL